MSEGRRKWRAQLKERERIPRFGFFRSLNGLDDSSLLTRSTQSNANLFQKRPHRHTQICFTSYLGISYSSQVDSKINNPSVHCEM